MAILTMIPLKLTTYSELVPTGTCSIITIERGDSDWDAEARGPEPGCDVLMKLLAQFLVARSGGKLAYAGFVEQRSGKLHAIQSENDVLRLSSVSHRPLEWLFMDIGNPSPKHIFDYEPYFKFQKYKDFDLNVFADSNLVIFNEADALYAEIISIKLNLAEVPRELTDICRYKLDSAFDIQS